MRDKPLLLAWKGMNFFQVGAGFKPNLGKGLWYPKLFPTSPPTLPLSVHETWEVCMMFLELKKTIEE